MFSTRKEDDLAWFAARRNGSERRCYGTLDPFSGVGKQPPEAPNVPKVAATLASLLLIASSIGVNIARYPQVGRMIDPGQAEAAEPASPAVAASPVPPVETPHAELSPAKPATGTPPQIPQEATSGVNPSPGRKTTEVKPSTAPAQVQVAIPIVDVRPMVPVASLQSGDAISNRNEVRRLPLVDNIGFASADAEGNLASSANTYPTTSTP
jgi:hypothetical protein